ncbi:tetratricopeptide repeat protein [bacterium]|nr:tetratricopeptide repeat protein [bacterium]MBU1883435.1 tetratricopeptide repeat protein [bacterium]
MKKILIFVTLLIVNVYAVDTQALLKAHIEALNVYQKQNRDINKTINILTKAGVQKVIDQKPENMTETQYIHLLNDYGFFLSETKERYKEALPIFKKVIKLSPKREVAYLNLGDLYLKEYQNNKDEMDKKSIQSMYKKYIALRRIKNPIPKIPTRVVEYVYFQDKIDYAASNVWGYNFIDDNKIYHSTSSLYLLKNNDFLYRYAKKNILFFAQVEVNDDFVFHNRTYNTKYIETKEIKEKLGNEVFSHQIAWLNNRELDYIYKSPLDLNVSINKEPTLVFKSTLNIETEKKKKAYQVIYYPKKSIATDSRQFCQGCEPVMLNAKVVDMNRLADVVIPLYDKTFLYQSNGLIIRIDENGHSKADFINKDVFIIDDETIQKLFYDSYDDTDTFKLQHPINAVYNYLIKNKYIKRSK